MLAGCANCPEARECFEIPVFTISILLTICCFGRFYHLKRKPRMEKFVEGMPQVRGLCLVRVSLHHMFDKNLLQKLHF